MWRKSMKIYSQKEGEKLLERFSKKMSELTNGSQDQLDALGLYMDFLSAIETWLCRIESKEKYGAFKLFGWQDFDNE